MKIESDKSYLLEFISLLKWPYVVVIFKESNILTNFIISLNN